MEKNPEKNTKTKVGLVLSAGGSAGAFATGAVHYLLDNKKREYDLVIGSSTGSLMAPSVAFGNTKKMVETYGTITNEDILTVNPFNKNNSLSFWNTFKNIYIKRKKSLGDNLALLKTIRKNFSEAEFRAIQMKTDIDIMICVNNATINTVEYKSIKDWEYREFTKWMWASATEPIIFENYYYEGCEYNDGAVLQHTAIEKAIEQGCQEIDVVCNKPIHTPKENWRSSNTLIKGFLDVVLRTFTQQVHNTFLLNMKIGQLLAEKHGVKLKIYSPPYRLTKNSLDFNKDKMKEWSQLGYVTAKMQDNVKETEDREKEIAAKEALKDTKIWVRFEKKQKETEKKKNTKKKAATNKKKDKSNIAEDKTP